ncbi:SLATT domain-containing protein [Streptomyces sp. NPDC051320]|uniref:SLATT domain-containing protein n=1 Tax=Streptomyces sp. NPDC051320 TaxID=3154644 RepID=UPI00342FEF6B
MGHPDMPQPEENTGRRGAAPGPGPGPASAAVTGPDLAGQPFPHGDWAQPAVRLDELYRFVETDALRTARWYLADRRWKRRGARALRLGTAAGGLAGAALPLLDLAAGWDGAAPWGYLALLGGAACAACDRWFGLTAGWMRDVATAQAVQRRLQSLQFDWASESVREVLGPAEGTASEAAERCLGVLRRFAEDVTELVQGETVEWMVGFRVGSVPAGVRVGVARADAEPLSGRGVSTVLTRPHMPRQRPPDSPPR